LYVEVSSSELVDDRAHASETFRLPDEGHDRTVLVKEFLLRLFRVVGHAPLLRRRSAVATIPLAARRFVFRLLLPILGQRPSDVVLLCSEMALVVSAHVPLVAGLRLYQFSLRHLYEPPKGKRRAVRGVATKNGAAPTVSSRVPPGPQVMKGCRALLPLVTSGEQVGIA